MFKNNSITADKTKTAEEPLRFDKKDIFALTIAFIQVLLPYILICIGIIVIIVFLLTVFWLK